MASTSNSKFQLALHGDDHHHHNLIRLWIGCCLGFLILAPIVPVMLGLHLHARDFQYISDENLSPPFDGRTVLLEVVLLNADPLAGLMTMDWNIVGEEKSECTEDDLGACSDLDILFDNNLLYTDDVSQVRTSDRPSQPIFRHNATAFVLNDIVANTPTFRTELALFSPGDRQSSLIYYPLINTPQRSSSFAQDISDNSTNGVEIFEDEGDCDTHAVTRPNVTIPPGMVDVSITLIRENLVKTFSIIAVIAIWLITLILLLVMLTCVFFGFRQKGEVLVIPVATLFAFSQLRQTMLGAPAGFSMYSPTFSTSIFYQRGPIFPDVFHPDQATFSISLDFYPASRSFLFRAALTLGAFILSDPTDKPQVLSRDLLFKAFSVLHQTKTRRVKMEDNRITTIASEADF